MSRITYENKVGIEPKTIAINQAQDIDFNMIKDVVNENDECSVSELGPILFDKTSAGRRFGSFAKPLIGTIELSTVNSQEGGMAMIVWEGSDTPIFIGGTVITLKGYVIEQGIYSIYIHFLNNGFNVNIFGKATSLPPSGIPAQQEIISVALNTAPAEMEISNITL